METVFSGIQPSGELHLGNCLGAVRTCVSLQDTYTGFYCIVDCHAVRQPHDPGEMPRRVHEMAIELLACGLDADRNTLFVQSGETLRQNPQDADRVLAEGAPRARTVARATTERVRQRMEIGMPPALP